MHKYTQYWKVQKRKKQINKEKDMKHKYEGRPINKLQNGIILLILKI